MHSRTCRSILASALLAMVTGCPTTKPEPTEPGIGAHVQRGKEKRGAENDLKQLGLFYINYCSQGNPPRNWQEFKPFFEREDRPLAQAIDEGRYVMNWKGARQDSNVVLAYEKEPDLRGSHVVVMGDGSVHTMTTQELNAALPNH